MWAGRRVAAFAVLGAVGGVIYVAGWIASERAR